mgnify:CR=1 FL=1
MQLTVWQFVMICPLVFLAGMVDALAGGGGLISLPAYMIAGIPVHQAIATNKLSAGMGTAVATAKYIKNGYVRWKIAIFCAVCALLGSSAGARLALMIEDGIFKRIMLLIIPLTGFYIMRSKALESGKPELPFGRMLAVSMVSALVIGVYDGFYGPGTGTFLMLLLTGVAHLKLTEANGLTKVINLSTNLAALTVYLLNGKVILLLGGVAGIFGIAGNYIGTCFFDKKGAAFVRPVMILVLVIFFIKVLTELWR